MGLHFGFPGLEARKEMLETWSWLQGGQKAGEVKVHERTGRQAGKASPHTRLRTRTETFCTMGVVGWNGGYITG